jgi:hypothetical protein
VTAVVTVAHWHPAWHWPHTQQPDAPAPRARRRVRRQCRGGQRAAALGRMSRTTIIESSHGGEPLDKPRQRLTPGRASERPPAGPALRLAAAAGIVQVMVATATGRLWSVLATGRGFGLGRARARVHSGPAL